MGRGQGTLQAIVSLGLPAQATSSQVMQLNILHSLPQDKTRVEVSDLAHLFPDLSRQQITGRLRTLINNRYVTRDKKQYRITSRGQLAAQQNTLDVGWDEVVHHEIERISSQFITVDPTCYSVLKYNDQPILTKAVIDLFPLLDLLETVTDNAGDEGLISSLKSYEIGWQEGCQETRGERYYDYYEL